MKLASWLKREGMTVSDFARKIGTAQGTVSRYLSHTRLPRGRPLKRIVTVTKGEVSPNDFYGK